MSINLGTTKSFDEHLSQPLFTQRFDLQYSMSSSQKQSTFKSLIKNTQETKSKYFYAINFNKIPNKTQRISTLIEQQNSQIQSIFSQNEQQSSRQKHYYQPVTKDIQSTRRNTNRLELANISNTFQEQNISIRSFTSQQEQRPLKTSLKLISQIRKQLDTIISIVHK